MSKEFEKHMPKISMAELIEKHFEKSNHSTLVETFPFSIFNIKTPINEKPVDYISDCLEYIKWLPLPLQKEEIGKLLIENAKQLHNAPDELIDSLEIMFDQYGYIDRTVNTFEWLTHALGHFSETELNLYHEFWQKHYPNHPRDPRACQGVTHPTEITLPLFSEIQKTNSLLTDFHVLNHLFETNELKLHSEGHTGFKTTLSEKQIEILYNGLKDNGYLKCSFDLFKTIFTTKPQEITFHGQINQLGYLLKNIKEIDKKDRWAKAAAIFGVKNNFANTLNQYPYPSKAEIFDGIIKKMYNV